MLGEKTYSIRAVLGRRDKIVGRLASEGYIGKKAILSELHGMSVVIAKCLPEAISFDLILESLMDLAGVELTREHLKVIAWRIAGNVDRLRNFHPAVPWYRQCQEEYVPVQVVGLKRQYRKKELRIEATLQTLAGTPVPLKITKTWSPKFFGLISKSMGFSKPWGEYPYRNPLQVYGMRFYVLVEPRLCDSSGPKFEKLWMDEDARSIRPSGCVRFNQELLKLRHRTRSQFECPENYLPEFECHRCAVGRDRCPIAVHSRTFVTRRCPRCEKVAFFDPEVSERLCIDCYDEQLRGVA
jgi:hypothetical protein